jgi:hypothetical protein
MTEKQATPADLSAVLADLPADFAFFEQAYREHVEPDLMLREEARVRAVARERQFMWMGLAFGAAAAGIGFLFFRSPVGLIIGGLGGMALYGWGAQELQQVGKETKMLLVEPVAREFGITFDSSLDEDPVDIVRMKNLGLVPSWDRAKFEDRLAGKRGDAPFEFFEAHLEEKRTTSQRGRTQTTWVTVFRGQCLVVHFPKRFEGVTQVFRDAGVFNSLMKLGQRHERVRLEDPKFERAFEVYGSDQVEARFILTPDFMERLLHLEETFSGKRLRCAFSSGEMLLAVEGKNLFEPGSMQRPMNDLGRVQEILQDFAAVFRLIDSVMKRQPNGDPPAA